MPDDRSLLSLDTSHSIPTRVLSFQHSGLRRRKTGQTGAPHRSDQYPSVRPTSQTGLEPLHLRLRFFGLGFVAQPRNPVVFW
jgi:hypothetical protein